MVDVLQIERVDAIAEEDAALAGFPSVATLEQNLQGAAGAQVYRIQLRLSPETDPRAALAGTDALSDEDIASLRRRLARLDQTRPWTTETLEAIAAQPGRRAGDLATQLGWSDLHDFKQHVRRLKALGLTISLPVGYRLSPRGEAYLQAISR